MSLADYLAKNYLTADPKAGKTSKKRKRKGEQQSSSGLVIADDDALGWDDKNERNDEEDGPTTVSGQTSAEFRRAKKNAWRTVGAPAPSSSEQGAADAIIASAAAENAARDAADDSAPAIFESDAGNGDGIAKMESGAHAGLQTAEQVTAAMKERQAEERARFLSDDAAHSGRGSETIYRDASGRIINVAMKRAEARKKLEAEEAAAAAALEAQKGAVQLAQRSEKRQALKDAKYIPVARTADDADLNAELKAQDRWNDPAAGFLESKRGASKSVSGKPLYTGPFVPNRYGIRPGHRWDGVDRGNGFEKEYFAARNRRKNVKDLEYAWQMDE
ncbi:MAG: Pre-mRNA-splicing factor cwc26 [Thelocarpon impressellum]|nr:MAG: Pre-mRNA-splicing factor cwc26 [Thelocarpon impressellum]